MQGFNRYIPADFDPRNTSTLNAHQGKKHALGKRAKDIDKGILIVRFELPFNIWCGTCNAHIGAGVRYNAQKKKVGNYYSTPIYGFRCKCHLCDGWFEIRTDPKNAAYVVHEGARKKDEEWDPAENGGFAIHDTDAPSASQPPADPFGHVEKTIDQQQWAKKNTSRLTELYHASTRLNGDPYVVSSALRRRFREEKKVMLEKQGRDDGLKERYGLAEDVDLGDESVERGREMWEAGRERAGLPIEPSGSEDGAAEEGSDSVRALSGSPAPGKAGGSGAGRGNATPDLGSLLRKTTARRYDPFASAADGLFGGTPTTTKAKARAREPPPIVEPSPVKQPEEPAPITGGLAVLAGYDSD